MNVFLSSLDFKFKIKIKRKLIKLNEDVETQYQPNENLCTFLLVMNMEADKM